MQIPSPESYLGRRCTSRRAAREARDQGVIPPAGSFETPIYRPFALLALAATLGVATPIGAITLYRLFAVPGPIPGVWLRLHAHLQIFGFAGVLIMGADSDSALMASAPGFYVMSLYGGVLGWVLGVAMRAVPMFITGRRVGRMGVPALVGLNGGALLAVLAESFPSTSSAVRILRALADVGLVVSLIAGSVAVGAWQPEPRHAIALHRDRIEARFFRFAFACARLAALGMLVDAMSRLAGEPAHGLLGDATLHLLTVGFMIGMICAMGFVLFRSSRAFG